MSRMAVTAGHLILALAFNGIYVFAYVRFLNRYFAYAGYSLLPRSLEFLALSVILAVAPVLAYRGVRGVSSVLAVFVYLLLYVPVVLTFALGSPLPEPHIILIQVTFALGMCWLFLSDAILVAPPYELRLKSDLMPVVLLGTIALTCFVLIVFRSNLRFVAFGEAVYEQRFANAQLGSGLATRYLSSWLNTVLVPLCLAYGLVTHRWRYFVTGSLACVAIYMATAAKSTILFPLIYGGVYLLFMNNRIRRFFPLMTVGLCAAIVSLVSIAELGTNRFFAASILMDRTIGNGGQMMMSYYDFFSFHPQTSYAHINAIQTLTSAYPYGSLGVGNVVGQFFWGPDVNANASFWATDGIAALGLPGVVIASAACALVFMLLNALTREHDPLFVVLCFLPFVVSLLNTSLFSSLWSGGALLLLVFFSLQQSRAPSTGGPRETVRERLS